jgi:hypothetical protein
MALNPGQQGATEILANMVNAVVGTTGGEIGVGAFESLPNGVAADLELESGDHWRVSLEYRGRPS